MFQQVFKTGTRLSSGSLVLRFAPSPDGQNRLSYLLRKKNLKLAVDRNSVRRQMREAFRMNQLCLNQPLWMVFDYKPPVRNQVEDGLFWIASDLLSQASIQADKKWNQEL
tara:strand:- start:2713 stop:3042 length:330 start_codon:yes stop_codon:yes gene_type:complete